VIKIDNYDYTSLCLFVNYSPLYRHKCISQFVSQYVQCILLLCCYVVVADTLNTLMIHIGNEK